MSTRLGLGYKNRKRKLIRCKHDGEGNFTFSVLKAMNSDNTFGITWNCNNCKTNGMGTMVINPKKEGCASYKLHFMSIEAREQLRKYYRIDNE